MKKIALSAALMALAFNAVSAEEIVVTPEENTKVENAFDTFYFGLGLGGSFVKYDAKDASAEATKKCNRFIGSAVLGAGKTFKQHFYVGGEFLMDFTKSKTREIREHHAAQNIDGIAKGKYQGITPQFAVRLGYVNPCWNTLFYGKMGVAYNRLKIDGEIRRGAQVLGSERVSKNKAGFVLGLGAEKMFCKKFSARVEADYNFGGKDGGLKFNKGFTVRALVSYNVKY